MVLRWIAAGMINAQRSFRRLKGYPPVVGRRGRAGADVDQL